MNRHTVIQTAIIVLLILLSFFAYTRQGDIETRLKRVGPGTDGKFSAAPLHNSETVNEPEWGVSKSPTEEEKAVIQPISHSGSINNGAYEVIGQVQNVGKITGKRIRARVIFRDASWHNRLGIIERPIDVPTLAPGQKSSFSVRFNGNAKQVGSYVLMMITEPKIPEAPSKLDELVQAKVPGARKAAGTAGEQVGPEKEFSPLVIPFLLGALLCWGAFRYSQWRRA